MVKISGTYISLSKTHMKLTCNCHSHYVLHLIIFGPLGAKSLFAQCHLGLTNTLSSYGRYKCDRVRLNNHEMKKTQGFNYIPNQIRFIKIQMCNYF